MFSEKNFAGSGRTNRRAQKRGQVATDYRSEAEPIYQTMVAAAGEAGYRQAHQDEQGLPSTLKAWIATVALPVIGPLYAASELKEQYASSDSGLVDACAGVSFVSAATGQEPPPPEPVPSAPASQEAAQKNPHPYGSIDWQDWQIARNGRLSVTSTLREQNIQTAKDVKPILEATAELCASGVGGQAYLTAEVVSGQELATGRQLTPVERTSYGTLLTVPVVGGVAAKSLGAGLKWLRPFVGARADAARALRANARITTEAAEVGSDLGGAVRSGRRLLVDVPGAPNSGKRWTDFADEAARIRDIAARTRGLDPNQRVLNMVIPRKKVLEKIAGYRKGIDYHLDDHIPALIGKADEGLVHYWRKEVSARIREMEGWAGRLSKNDDILAEAAEYRRRLDEILDQRLRELAD